MHDALNNAWESGGKTANDPGLREIYSQIERAPIRLIVLPLGKSINQGGMTRVADAYRIQQVDFAKEPDRAIDFAAQRGSKGWQPWSWNEPDTALESARADGCTIVALTISERAIDVANFEWTFPCAIVVGEENAGVPSEIEAKCDASIAIPLYGLINSLNVVTATAICLEYAIRAYSTVNADFRPVRTASRKLIGLPPTDYSESL